MNNILYRSLSSGQLYIYDINNKPVSKIQMIKYYLEGNSNNKVFILFVPQEDFKSSKDVNYFIKIPCSSLSYCFLDLYEHTYKNNKRYGINAKLFNSIEDFKHDW